MARRPFLYVIDNRSFFALALTFFCVLTSCSDNRVEEVQQLAPQVPEDCIRQLLDSDDDTFETYAREMGPGFLYEISRRLGAGLDWSSEEDFARTREQLLPLMFRVSRFIQSERGDDDPFPINYPTMLENLAPVEAVRRHGLFVEREAVLGDTTLSATAKATRLEQYAIAYEQDGLIDEAGWCWWRMANLLGTAGDLDGRLRLLTRAVDSYRQTDRYRFLCQLLGVLGSAYEDAGHVDSMFVAYEEGRRIADRLELPNHAARIRVFEANYYRRAGRLSVAHDLYNEAQEICREYGGGHYELRYVYEAMRFYAELGAWEIVEQLLHRAHALLRGATVEVLANQDLHRVRIARLEARRLMASGSLGEANALFEDYGQRAASLPWKWEYALYLWYWSQGLIDNDMPRRALPLIDAGLKLSDEMGSSDYSARFMVTQARAYHALGERDNALAAITSFDRLTEPNSQVLRREWVRRDVLAVRIAGERGDIAAGREALATALTRLRGFLSDMDAGAHGYLWLSECDELRQLLHEAAGDDAVMGYGIEQYWRDHAVLMGAARRGGTARLPHTSADDLFSAIRRRGEDMQRRIDADDVHCVFAVVGEDVVRWTCRSDGIRRDALALAPEDLNARVVSAWGAMATEPDSRDVRPGAGLMRDLTQLGGALLPAELRDGRWKNTRFLVTASGTLAKLPFETLNVASENDYVPLISFCDVAYVRRTNGGGVEAAAGTGVIMTNATVAASLRRRHPFQAEVPNVEREGRAVAANHPDARLLMGPDATKNNLIIAWRDASFVYMATHILRDPEAPYYALIPLAKSPVKSDRTTAYLDIADVRAADFSTTGIVVLSGCSSGTPYVGARATGPSISDAFVDAGARVVVGTFWDVRDDYAAELMAEFVGQYDLAGASALEPLSEVRRRLIEGPNGVRHPFHWASYAVTLGEL